MKEDAASDAKEQTSDKLAGVEVIAFLLLGVAPARWIIEFPQAQLHLLRLFH